MALLHPLFNSVMKNLQVVSESLEASASACCPDREGVLLSLKGSGHAAIPLTRKLLDYTNYHHQSNQALHPTLPASITPCKPV